MITGIIDIFNRQAREHKAIRAFYYNRNYELGSGREMYPMLWLEDPISGRNHGNTFLNSVNFSVLFLPSQEQSTGELQNMAFSIGLNILERIKCDKESPACIQPDWTYMLLRDYYDDNATGCRFSVSIIQRNMQDLCLIDEQFDKNGRFENRHIPETGIPPVDNCEVYRGKLPEFTLKTRK